MKSLLTSFMLIFCAATPATTTTAPAENAATLYRQAFAEIDTLSEDDGGRLGLCGTDGCWVVTTPLDAKTADLLERQKNTIALLRRAGQMRKARWELAGDAGKMVELANHHASLTALMVLKAREELKDAKPQAAVDDFMVGMTIARHAASTQPTIMTKMVEVSAARPVIEGLAEQLPSLPREIVATLPERLEKLPKSVPADQVIRGEYEFAKATTRKQGAVAMFMVAGLKDFYDALAKGASLPPDKFDALVDQQMAKFSLNPFAKIIGPSLKGTRQSGAMLETKQAMLNTAIDIIIHGDSALAASKDPFGSGPFTMQKLPRGFELTSALIVRDKPVTLRVGANSASGKN